LRELVEDLLMLGEVAAVFAPFVPQQARACLHHKVTLAAGAQLDLGLWVPGGDRGGQTGRLRLVVSNDAVVDRDVHAVHQCRTGIV
jgi:hypothetical protein